MWMKRLRFTGRFVTYPLLQGSDLFPGFDVLSARLEELLVGQVEGLADGEGYLFSLGTKTHTEQEEEPISKTILVFLEV